MLDLSNGKTYGPTPNFEAILTRFSFTGLEPTFRNLLPFIEEKAEIFGIFPPRFAAMTRFVSRELTGKIETRAQMNELDPFDEVLDDEWNPWAK